jgi:SNF2 family DNA or RNA helicase
MSLFFGSDRNLPVSVDSSPTAVPANAASNGEDRGLADMRFFDSVELQQRQQEQHEHQRRLQLAHGDALTPAAYAAAGAHGVDAHSKTLRDVFVAALSDDECTDIVELSAGDVRAAADFAAELASLRAKALAAASGGAPLSPSDAHAYNARRLDLLVWRALKAVPAAICMESISLQYLRDQTLHRQLSRSAQLQLDQALTKRARAFLPLFIGVEAVHIGMMDLDGSMAEVPFRLRPMYLKLAHDQLAMAPSDRLTLDQLRAIVITTGDYAEALRVIAASKRERDALAAAASILPLADVVSRRREQSMQQATLAHQQQQQQATLAHQQQQQLDRLSMRPLQQPPPSLYRAPQQQPPPQQQQQLLSALQQRQLPPADNNLNPSSETLPIGDLIVPVKTLATFNAAPMTPVNAQIVTQSLEIRFEHGGTIIGVMSLHHSRKLATLLMKRVLSMTSAVEAVDPLSRATFLVRCRLLLEKRLMATGTPEEVELALQHKQTADDREPPLMFILNRVTPRCRCCQPVPAIDPRSDVLNDMPAGSRVIVRQPAPSLAASSDAAGGADDEVSRAAKQSILSAPDKQLQQMAPPAAMMKLSIYSYQEQALWWMVQCETAHGTDENPLFLYRHTTTGVPFYAHKFRPIVWAVPPPTTSAGAGGILADDMGVGKTVETLSLIVTRTRPPQDRVGESIATTLVVLPLSLLDQWANEIKRFTKLTHLTLRGRKDVLNNQHRMRTVDVVLTTYNTLAADYKEAQETSPLFAVEWWRVVLDEAHLIRSRMTLKAKSVFDLKAVNRWCLTGTPIQNKIEDIYALLRFLRVHPFDDYAWFNYLIGKPLSAAPDTQLRERADAALSVLRGALHPRLLRRLKSEVLGGAADPAPSKKRPITDEDDDDDDDDNNNNDNDEDDGAAAAGADADDNGDASDDSEFGGAGKPAVKRRATGGGGGDAAAADASKRSDFKGRQVNIVRLRMAPSEAKLYNWMAQRVTARVQALSDQGQLGRNISNVLEMLLRLRQCCSHPFLVLTSLQTKLKKLIAGSKPAHEINDVRAEINHSQALLRSTAHAAWLTNGSSAPASRSASLTATASATSGGGGGGDDLFAQANSALLAAELAMGDVDAIASGATHDAAGGEDEDLKNAIRASLEEADEFDRFFASLPQLSPGGDAVIDLGSSPVAPPPLAGESIVAEPDGSASLLSAGFLARPVPESAVQDSAGDALAFSLASSAGGGAMGAAAAAADDEDDDGAEGGGQLWSTLDRHFVPSTKIAYVVSRLHELRGTTREKSIVFCQFTSMLDLLGVALKREKLQFERFDGSMTTTARSRSLSHFRDDKSCVVLLCSLKAGNLGLNLECASRVFLFAPWFNPYVEEQAIARVDRLGQRREVFVERLIMEGTIEENLLKMQARKTQLVERAGLKAEDIKTLLDMPR